VYVTLRPLTTAVPCEGRVTMLALVTPDPDTRGARVDHGGRIDLHVTVAGAAVVPSR
jgi:hypothetical protein